MTIKQAIEKIVKDWGRLYDAQRGLRLYSKPKLIAVWCAKDDTAGSYEVNEEWIGITPSGEIAWAYASGCSCWDGDFTEKRYESLKEVILNHDKNTPKDWENAIIKFAETEVMQDL